MDIQTLPLGVAFDQIAAKLDRYEPRPQQIKLSEAIQLAIASNESVIAEAGTGTGKSIAYLLPALLSGKKVLVSTHAKALQDQLSKKDLPFLVDTVGSKTDIPFQVLKGIGNYVCLEALHENTLPMQASLMHDNHDIAMLERWLIDTETGDLGECPVPIEPDTIDAITTSTHDCAGSHCQYAADCHYLRAKQRAEDAQIIIVNHALLAADITLRYKTGGDFSILPDREVIILDEAHAFEEAATSAFTLELSIRDSAKLLRSRVARTLEFNPTDIQRAINGVADLFGQLSNLGVGTHQLTSTPTLRMAALTASQTIDKLAADARRRLASQSGGRYQQVKRYADRLAEHARDFIRVFADGASQDEYVLYVENTHRRSNRIVSVVKWTPIAAGRILRRALWDVWPTVAVSATMTTHGNFQYIRERLGVPAAVTEAIVGSPFKYKQNALIYFPRDGARFDPTRVRMEISEHAYYDDLAQEITGLVKSTTGGVLVLFTSRKAMEACFDRCFPVLADSRDYIYQQGAFPASTLIQKMRDHGNVVVFALRTFWTGIDVTGDALSMVILDKLPFPNPDDPVFKARCEKANKFFDDEWAWFNRLALPACVIQLKQGVGRLIRSQTDRGVIAILDGRLGSKGYGTGIVRSLPPAMQTRSVSDVQRFFSRALPSQGDLL